jgi:hypothetical protein
MLAALSEDKHRRGQSVRRCDVGSALLITVLTAQLLDGRGFNI